MLVVDAIPKTPLPPERTPQEQIEAFESLSLVALAEQRLLASMFPVGSAVRELLDEQGLQLQFVMQRHHTRLQMALAAERLRTA